MDFDILHLQVPFLSECQFTCRLQQEHQYAEREEDDFGQPVSGICGWLEGMGGLPEYYAVSQGIP